MKLEARLSGNHGSLRLILLFLALTPLARAQVTNNPNCVPMPSGAISWWRAENSATDSWGTNDGTISGVSYATGKVGRAFATGTGYVSVTDRASLRLTNGLTIEAWVNPLSLVSAEPRAILSKFDGVNSASQANSSYLLGLTNGALFLSVIAQTPVNTKFTLIADQPLPTNQWSFVAGTYDGSALRLFVNGVQVKQMVFSGGVRESSAALGVGAVRSISATFWPFNGYLDEVTLYGRGLAATELDATYNAAAGKCLSAPVIVVQPQSKAIPLEEDVLLSVGVYGIRPLYYQWRFNGQNLPLKTAQTLLLEKVGTNNVGSYSVRITNGLGASVSSNAQITLLPAPTCVSAPAGIVSWWPGDGSLLDGVGTNHGMILTVRSQLSFSPGKVDLAASEINVPNSPSVNFGLASSFSIEAWVKIDSSILGNPLIQSSLLEILSKLDFDVRGPSLNGYQLVVDQGRLAFAIGEIGGPISNGSRFTAPGPNLIDSVYHHVAVTVQRGITSGGRLYVDGQEVLVFNPPSMSYSNSAMLTIGMPTALRQFPIPGQDPRGPIGWVDETAIYNRALSAAEIASIHQAGSAGKCKTPPSLGAQPASQIANENSNPTFSVSANGPSLRYQWRFKGSAISGATRSTLTLTNVAFSQSGAYSVVVSNAFGSVLSSNAVLTINRRPLAACRTISLFAGGACTADGSVNAGSVDPDGDPIQVSQLPSGPYALGTNLVALTVTDNRGASNTCMAQIIVLDDQVPTIICPADITVTNAHDAWSSVVSFTPTVSDNCPAVGPPVSDPASGSAFVPGTHLVTCSVTDAAGNSSACVFGITVLPGNLPPKAVIAISPLASLPGLTNWTVIAGTQTNAAVTLDGSASQDPDDAVLQYAWLEGEQLLSTQAVTTNSLPPGTHWISLRVDDGFPYGTNTATVRVDVITAGEAMALIVALVETPEVDQKLRQPLLASLRAAMASNARGEPTPAVNQLQAFQTKVRVQLKPVDPVNAEKLVRAADDIIRVLSSVRK